MMLNRVSLNTIGLNRIGLNRIGKPSRGSSERPYIDPEVLASLKAVCICYGKSNDDPDRAIVKNLVDPDNPFVISNAAYTEGSGYADKDSPYYGAFVTDGIDDLITSTKSATEMLDGSNEITVVSMIHQIKTNSDVTRNNWFFTPVSYLGNRVVENKTGKTGIYGYTSTNVTNAQISDITPILGDKNDYTLYSKIEDGDRDYFTVEGFQNQGIWYVSSIAWYWTIIANKVLTTDQINQVIAYFNLDRTLKPDILCNVKKQGITNENHAEFGDRLIDFSGNGRDIQLNNIAWKGDSGIGKYETELSNTSIWTKGKETTSSPFSSSYNGLSGWIVFANTELTNSADMPSFKIQVKGLLEGQELIYRYYDSNGQSNVYSMGKDGEYTLPSDVRTAKPQTSNTSGFQVVKNETNIITITQIPSHAGAFCLDGVNDFGKVTGMPIYKDYTFIIEREFLNETFPNQVCLVSKSKVASEIENGGAFIVDNISVNSIINPYSFYKTTSLPGLNTFDRQIVFQSKYKYLDKDIAAGTATDSDTLWLGTFRDNDSRFANVAIYSLMSFPYSMSEFLIERQLKKHKLGTLYPDMVEFRPIIKQDDRIKSIKYYIDGKTANIGQYYPIGTGLGIAVETVQPYMVKSLKVNGVNTIPNADYKGFNARLDSKSPQKITMDIVVDTSIILFNPTINSNAIFEVGNEETMPELFTQLNNGEIDGIILYMQGDKAVLPNNWIDKNTKVRAIIYCLDTVSEEDIHFTVDGKTKYCYSAIEDGLAAFGIMDEDSQEEQYMTNVLTANTIDIQLDQYIRYEDIVQPYPVLLRFNDENGNEVSWGGKFRVGSTITRIGSAADSNLLPNIYNIFGLLLNDNQVTSSKVIVEKTMVFKAKSAYIFDNNEPNCILSPRLLRIPNSSYKILGHIPDISGHGNHGVIHNSAYIEGSGVNEDGSYQFDGVDDFVTIPTVTGGGKQVLMKVNNNTINSMLYDQRSSYASPNSLNSDFAIYNTNTVDNNLIAYQSRLVGKTYIDGILNTNITCEDLLGVLHNITITCDIVVPNNGVVPNIGRGGVLKDLYSKVALYDFMLFDEISTEDKIKELNEYIGIEAKVELPPYYYDAYGKTNLDEDKAIIQQRGIAVGDYDLTNTNFAYNKMSGFGGYSLGRFDKSWASSSSNNTSVIVVLRNPYDITLKKLGGNSDWEFNNTELKVISNPVSVKFKPNKNIRFTCDYHYYPVGGNSEGTPLGITSKDLIANEDTVITIPPISQENIDKYNIDINRGYYLVYFQLSSTLAVNEEVTIEMLPLYPNGLVYDGVTDYSMNTNIPALTDYTYILKRQILKGIANSAVMYKGNITVNQGGAFICNYCEPSDTNLFTDFSFGGLLRSNDIDKPIIYGTKTSVNGDSITPGENIDTVGINVGKWVNYLPMVLYKLILYPKTIPLLQINFLKNLMERDEIIDLDNPIFIQE